MKKIAIIVLLSMTIKVSAQNPVFIPSGKDRYKQVAGRYGSSSGICLFDDGKFLLYGYATMVFGSYGFEKDYLNFYPDKLERFLVFATQNRTIGDSARIYFQGFEEGVTYVKFDDDKAQRVFNENANCFAYPYVYKRGNAPTTITLVEKPTEEWWYQNKEPNAWTFKLDDGYNDIMLLYNEPRRERQDFSAMIELKDGVKVLKLSNYGGDEGYVGEINTEDDDNWKKVLEYKNQYNTARQHEDTLYANQHYNTFSIHDSYNYAYDTAIEMYVDTPNKDNDSYYQNNDYGDSRYLRKYAKQMPVSKYSIAIGEVDANKNSLFYTVCDDATSYEYEGLKSHYDYDLSKSDIDESQNYSTVDSVSYNDFRPFEPFYVDLEDGFYEVKQANYADNSKTVFGQNPALTKKDIEAVSMTIDERGVPVANIKFTSKAATIFEELTRKNINKPIVIVVNNKVITMPVIIDTIKGGEVSISGGYTVEEIKEIVEHLMAK